MSCRVAIRKNGSWEGGRRGLEVLSLQTHGDTEDMENVPSTCSYLVYRWHAFGIHRPRLKGWDEVWLLTSNTFLQKQFVKEMLLNTLF